MSADKNRLSHIQGLLNGTVLSAQPLNPGYPNTNEVWLVTTEEGDWILKISGHSPRGPQNTFWTGLRSLFGCHPLEELSHQASLSDQLNALGEIPVPRVLKCVEGSASQVKKPYLILEKMPGSPLPFGSPREQAFVRSAEMMRQLGRQIDRLHSAHCRLMGNFPETRSISPSEYPERLAFTLQALARHPDWIHDQEVQEALPHFLGMARRMPSPDRISLIMPDIGPSQFLADDDCITALVDIESYVRGPIEMELVGLEFDVVHAVAFQQGYQETGDAFPALNGVRPLYRFFYYLLFNAPPKGIKKWLDAPVRFC